MSAAVAALAALGTIFFSYNEAQLARRRVQYDRWITNPATEGLKSLRESLVLPLEELVRSHATQHSLSPGSAFKPNIDVIEHATVPLASTLLAGTQALDRDDLGIKLNKAVQALEDELSERTVRFLIGKDEHPPEIAQIVTRHRGEIGRLVIEHDPSVPGPVEWVISVIRGPFTRGDRTST